MKRTSLEFSSAVKKKAIERSGNRCERCSVDFDEDFIGEFHHINPIVYGGDNSFENCSLLCHNCHMTTPNVKDKGGILIYKYFFLRFASFKEAFQYFKVDNRYDLYTKVALDIAKISKKESK